MEKGTKWHFCPAAMFVTEPQMVPSFLFKVDRYASSVGFFTVVQSFFVCGITGKSIIRELI